MEAEDKSDICRIPGFDEIMANGGSSKAREKDSPKSSGGFLSDMVSKLSKAGGKGSDKAVPSLGLSGGILSAERKFASLSRTKKKASAAIPAEPARQACPADNADNSTARQYPAPPQSPQHRIIAEIVAKDIIKIIGP